jgi:hypothetical protein
MYDDMLCICICNIYVKKMGDTAKTASSYFQDCSVTNSQFRCYVVHGMYVLMTHSLNNIYSIHF